MPYKGAKEGHYYKSYINWLTWSHSAARSNPAIKHTIYNSSKISTHSGFKLVMHALKLKVGGCCCT